MSPARHVDPNQPMIDEDVQHTLVRSPLFRGVSPVLVTSIAARSESRLLSPREKLLSAGSQNQRLYVVLSGTVSARVPGTDVAHVLLEPGDCVGEISILDGQPVSADVIAEESTVVLSFDRQQLWELIDASADVARNLLRLLAGRVRHDDEVLGESSRLQRYFERIATVDGLTGLRNRRWLDDAFARQLDRAARTDQPVSLLMINLDHFKLVNDQHGHLVGDAVLSRVSQTLSATLRPQDLLARYGGEEFAVLLPGIDVTSATAVAERLRLAVESVPPIPSDGVNGPLPAITVSIGVTTGRAYETLPDLLKRADSAMYRAKEGGRNRTSE